MSVCQKSSKNLVFFNVFCPSRAPNGTEFRLQTSPTSVSKSTFIHASSWKPFWNNFLPFGRPSWAPRSSQDSLFGGISVPKRGGSLRHHRFFFIYLARNPSGTPPGPSRERPGTLRGPSRDPLGTLLDLSREQFWDEFGP